MCGGSIWRKRSATVVWILLLQDRAKNKAQTTNKAYQRRSSFCGEGRRVKVHMYFSCPWCCSTLCKWHTTACKAVLANQGYYCIEWLSSR
ncbi:hypothetical protein BX070DRAFT_222619 [Coemansia spiralis]|nr:hypothetical protein BX070DRAFT_222619 [Coemansia spiralis]